MKTIDKGEKVEQFGSMNTDDEFSPEDALEEIEEMPRKVELVRYRDAMIAMRTKGYSYREVADWLGGKLGISITRNQISYVVNTDVELQRVDDVEEELEDQADEMTGGIGS